MGVIAFFSGVSLVVLALGYFIDHDKIADFVAFSIFVILLAAFLSGYANGDL